MKGPFIRRALPVPRFARSRSTDSNASGFSGVTMGLILPPRSTTKPAFFFGRFVSRLAQYRGLPVPQMRHLPDQTPLISMRWRPLICVYGTLLVPNGK